MVGPFYLLKPPRNFVKSVHFWDWIFGIAIVNAGGFVRMHDPRQVSWILDTKAEAQYIELSGLNPDFLVRQWQAEWSESEISIPPSFTFSDIYFSIVTEVSMLSLLRGVGI